MQNSTQGAGAMKLCTSGLPGCITEENSYALQRRILNQVLLLCRCAYLGLQPTWRLGEQESEQGAGHLLHQPGGRQGCRQPRHCQQPQQAHGRNGHCLGAMQVWHSHTYNISYKSFEPFHITSINCLSSDAMLHHIQIWPCSCYLKHLKYILLCLNKLALQFVSLYIHF